MSVANLLAIGLILAIAGLLLTEVTVWRVLRRVTKLERQLQAWNAAADRVAKTLTEGRPWCSNCNNQGRPFSAAAFPGSLCALCHAEFERGPR